MSNTTTLIDRNRQFANEFTAGGLPIIPKLRTVIVSCGDSRVDPAHILGLKLGDAVVIRNNGGRITPSVVEELTVLSFMVAKMDGTQAGPFEVIIIHHTQCGAERFADSDFQEILKEQVGVDVTLTAIHDHEQSLQEDIERLKDTPNLPDHIVVSGLIYNVENGQLREVIAPTALKSLKKMR